MKFNWIMYRLMPSLKPEFKCLACGRVICGDPFVDVRPPGSWKKPL